MLEKIIVGATMLIMVLSYLILNQNPTQEKLINESPIYDSFTHWKTKYSKTYGAEENQQKYQVFKQNYEFVHGHNQKEDKLQLELNQFADMTNQEFKEVYHGYKHQQSNKQEQLEDKQIPDQLDWREKGAVTRVKDQGQCGSCWAFSAVGALEGLYFIQNGNLLEFSEQDLIDCSSQYGNQGCNGGLMDNAFQYVIDKGICEETSYPYKKFQDKCQLLQDNTQYKIEKFVDVPQNSNKQLILAVNQGPVSVAIDAGSQYFQLYKSGILTQECGTNLNHGVLLVGYGEENGVKYYIIKNSWGPDWGEKGFIRILRTDKDEQGSCGITLSASYPQKITSLSQM